jgi:hypothetical protein
MQVEELLSQRPVQKKKVTPEETEMIEEEQVA